MQKSSPSQWASSVQPKSSPQIRVGLSVMQNWQCRTSNGPQLLFRRHRYIREYFFLPSFLFRRSVTHVYQAPPWNYFSPEFWFLNTATHRYCPLREKSNPLTFSKLFLFFPTYNSRLLTSLDLFSHCHACSTSQTQVYLLRCAQYRNQHQSIARLLQWPSSPSSLFSNSGSS